MRVYGRTGQVNGFGGTWTEVTTDANGFDDAVYFTALIQCLKLNLGESPFWGNRGVPYEQAIIQQIPPDYFIAQIQQQYAPYFAALAIRRTAPAKPTDPPTYFAQATGHTGATFSATVAT